MSNNIYILNIKMIVSIQNIIRIENQTALPAFTILAIY